MKTGKSAAAAWMLYLLMVIMLFLFLAPFGIVFFNSLKPLNEILLDPLSLPDQLHFENFTQAWTILNVPKPLAIPCSSQPYPCSFWYSSPPCPPTGYHATMTHGPG